MYTRAATHCCYFLISILAIFNTDVRAQGKAGSLSVVSFGGALQDAQREVYFKPFGKQFNVTVTDVAWDGGIDVLRKKVGSMENSWDLVQVESEELLLGCKEGLFEKVNWVNIGSRDNYLPQTVSDCGVGSIIYNFVLAYDTDRIKGAAPKSWADFFDAKGFPGKRSLRKGPKTNLELALLADGVTPKDVYKVLRTPAGVDRAFEKLTSIKKDIVWWEKGAQPPEMLISGEVVMASVYNGRVSAANKAKGKNLKMIWTNSLYTVDSWVILKGSPHKKEAEKFLEFAGGSAIQKEFPQRMPYGLSNKYATMLVDPAVWENLPTNPQNIRTALQIEDQFWVENLAALSKRYDDWLNK